MFLKYTIFFLSFLFISFSSCTHQFAGNKTRKQSIRYGEGIVPLSLDHSYFQSTEKGNQFWKIMPYYKHQSTGSSCSVATASLVMNALVGSASVPRDIPLFTEERILKISNSKNWEKATREDDSGLTLSKLHSEMQNLLIKTGLDSKYSSSYYEMSSFADELNFRKFLKKFENGDGQLILFFAQGELMEEKEIYPHFSPIGAYDEKSDRILIIDTDGSWYEPYWAPVGKIISNMTQYDVEMKCQRGYLWVGK